jgi:TonB family protein
MRGNFKQLCVLLIFTVAASMASPAQSSVSPEWHRVVSTGEDFSVALPVGYIVHKESRTGQVALVGSGGGASFEVTLHNTSGAVGQLQRMDATPPKKGESSTHMIDDALVRLYTYRGSKIFRTSVWTATGKGLYRIELSAPSLETEALARILASLQLKGRGIIKDPKLESPITNVVIKASALESSDIVKAAMKRKQSERIEVETAPASYETEDREVIYTRRLLIVYRVRAAYNDAARNKGIQGLVRVRILFKGNGNIGKVTILKGLPSGLNAQVVDAVRRIKFVPAEINGMPADAERTLEYTFSIIY